MAWIEGAGLAIREGWPRLLPGLFAQGGIAEETLFRGYLFRQYRERRSFWRAAWLSTIPSTAVHLLMLLTQPLAIALASILLAIAISFPMAWLFEMGGRTIWAPALVHFVVQGALKILVIPDRLAMEAAIGWIAVSALLPYLVFFVRDRRSRA